VSLAEDPTYSLLKKYFVCGYKDITNEPYSGVSNRHEFGDPAVDTTNGAGPRNLQIFMMASDGTVLTVLPGYWHSEDIAPEMNLAARLNKVWLDPRLSRGQKDAQFRQMHLAHISQHSPAMVSRSKMQGFDMMYEAKERMQTSDVIADRGLAQAMVSGGNRGNLASAFKTTDVIMHERMAARPFERYTDFDVAAYADYGKQKYDKNENRIAVADSMGYVSVPHMGMKEQEIGNPQALLKAHPNMAQRQARMNQVQQYQPQAPRSGVWGQGPTWGNGGR